MLRKVQTEDSVGMILAHDVTKVVPGQFKGPLFSKGHLIEKGDIPELLNIGKEHVYVLELGECELHEEEAALRIARAIAGSGLELTEPKEGRVDLKARFPGLLRIDLPLLIEVNSIDEVMVATIHNNTVCHSGMVVAGTRIIPLFTTEAKIGGLEKLCRGRGPLLEIAPIGKKDIGVVITGTEVFKGRIQDRFTEVIQRKLEGLGSTIHHRIMVPDDIDLIAQAITELKLKGSQVILACGGMSVDPDDVTPEGIEKAGGRIVSYGAPVLPGAMFLYAKCAEVPVLGVPACVLHAPTTILDLILPRVLAGEDISREEILKLGHGGLCLRCAACSYPTCPFGR